MKRAVILFFLGGLSALAMAPWNLWPALFAGISGLYILLCRAQTPLQGFALGFVFSFAYFVFSLSWIGNALLVEGNPYWWAWPLAVSGLPALLAMFTAAGCCVYKHVCKNTNTAASYMAFVLVLGLCDYARGHLFTGFPWNLYGYTWIDILPVAQIAALSDIYLLNLATIFWTAAPGFLLTANHTPKIKAVLGVLIATGFLAGYGFGLYRMEHNPVRYHPDYEAVIVQPNIKQNEKWAPEKRADNFQAHIDLSRYNPVRHNPDMRAYYIIWPETTLAPDLLHAPWVMDAIRSMLQAYPGKAWLITGALRYENESYFNSIITFNSAGDIIQTYNKSHLVPFGEYMPFESVFDIAPVVGFTGFQKGEGKKTLALPENLTFSPLICYEIIFPGESVDTATPAPDMIINVTNDAWYGNSAGPHQHLVQSKFRAIETGIPVLRSANTGISALITPLGYSAEKKKLLQKGVIIHKIPHSLRSD